MSDNGAEIKLLSEALEAMCAEFRAHDLPYGSKSYERATNALNALRAKKNDGPPEYLCYDLDFEYRDKYGDARTMNHTYTAEHPAASVRAALAFWNERHKNLPGVFSMLLCCKIHPVLIGPITDGRIINGVGLPFFEYKCDTAGLPKDEYFEMRANQLERK